MLSLAFSVAARCPRITLRVGQQSTSVTGHRFWHIFRESDLHDFAEHVCVKTEIISTHIQSLPRFRMIHFDLMSWSVLVIEKTKSVRCETHQLVRLCAEDGEEHCRLVPQPTWHLRAAPGWWALAKKRCGDGFSCHSFCSSKAEEKVFVVSHQQSSTSPVASKFTTLFTRSASTWCSPCKASSAVCPWCRRPSTSRPTPRSTLGRSMASSAGCASSRRGGCGCASEGFDWCLFSGRVSQQQQTPKTGLAALQRVIILGSWASNRQATGSFTLRSIWRSSVLAWAST